ncbi:MAG: DUF6517 family protein [Haloarculaceae archaeon]
MHRRTFLAGSAVALAAGTAGCGFILGDEPLEFEAEPASVAESTAGDAGYELQGINEETLEQTFEAAGESRTVTVTNRMAEYEKRVDLGPLGEHRAAIFTALSTPAVSILDESFNPVAKLSTADLAERIQSRFEQIGQLERDDQSAVTIFGTETTQTRFTGQARLAAGQEVDIYLHLSEAVEHEADLVIGIGAYPQRLPGQASSVLAMMEGIEHPTP